MSITERIINTTPDRVFAVLADGWTYSDWVVGTAHIRDVDRSWPAAGSSLHHKVGPWPVSIKDKTTSMECQPDRMVQLKVHLWPLGEGHVRITLDPLGVNSTHVTMQEEFTQGPLLWLKTKVNDLALHQRNVEALRRLADLAEHRRQE